MTDDNSFRTAFYSELELTCKFSSKISFLFSDEKTLIVSYECREVYAKVKIIVQTISFNLDQFISH